MSEEALRVGDWITIDQPVRYNDDGSVRMTQRRKVQIVAAHVFRDGKWAEIEAPLSLPIPEIGNCT